jgi:hypothetical protein
MQWEIPGSYLSLRGCKVVVSVQGEQPAFPFGTLSQVAVP